MSSCTPTLTAMAAVNMCKVIRSAYPGRQCTSLLGIAYQADHHPQNCYQGPTRELVWRHVSVAPVKYASTSSAPRNGVTSNVQRQLGWLGYDLRDIQRFGPAVNGVAQANEVKYQPWGHMAFTSRDLTG